MIELSKSQLSFRTYDYNLKASLRQSRLFLEIEDLEDYIIYSRQFTQEDIGKSIHQRVKLEEIFQTLQLGKQKIEQQKIEQLGYNSSQCTLVGDIVYSAEKTPCFKVDAEGVITIYVCYWKASKKQFFSFQSVLKLNKSLHQKINIPIQKLKKLKKFRKQKTRLQCRNRRLKVGLDNIKKRFQILQKRSTAILKQAARNYQKELAKSIYSAQEQSKISFYQNLVQLKQPYSSNFLFYPSQNGCKIIYIGENQMMTQLIFNQVVKNDEIFKFKTKILQTSSSDVTVGIVNETRINQRFSFDSGNAVCFNGLAGAVFPEEGKGAKRFKQGQTVQTIVDSAHKVVKWYVGGRLKAKCKFQGLGDSSLKFRPYVEMQDFNDQIQVIFEQ